MQDELNQFERNQVWKIVPRIHDRQTIGTYWVFRNKSDKSGNIVINKARLAAQGYNQIEGIDLEEIFTPMARLKAILMTLAYASFKDFKLFQMDVKSTLLNSFIEEEMYVEQSLAFVDHAHPDYVFKLEKALYNLKQAPRAWFKGLVFFL